MRQWWMKSVCGALGLALFLTVATVAQAQPNSAAINATATVLTPLTVSAGNDLGFGNVFPGVNASIAITDPTAGRWDITGQNSAEVTLTFTLPANLVNGINNLPIVFGAGDSGHNTANNAATATTFDPGAGATTNLSGIGELWVWLGGTVQPASSQAAGLYTETATLTVDYTGN